MVVFPKRPAASPVVTTMDAFRLDHTIVLQIPLSSGYVQRLTRNDRCAASLARRVRRTERSGQVARERTWRYKHYCPWISLSTTLPNEAGVTNRKLLAQESHALHCCKAHRAFHSATPWPARQLASPRTASTGPRVSVGTHPGVCHRAFCAVCAPHKH